MSARNVVLILMFGSLFYGGYVLYRSHTIQPLQADLIAIDTASISQLRIYHPQNEERLVHLQREGDNWIASNGQVHLRALQGPVEAILRNLVKITTIDIAAKKEADWQQYGLIPGQSVRVEVYQDDALLEDFWVGYTLPDTARMDSLSFIRIHQEQEVYAVKGMKTWPFYQTFTRFRPKDLLSLPTEMPIDSFSLQYPDSLFSFRRSDDQWELNGQLLEEPARVNQYLKDLSQVTSTNFVDDYDYNQPESNKFGSLLLYVPGSGQPILINVFVDTLRDMPYIFHSSQNPTTWFGGDSSGIYRRLFGPLAPILPKKDTSGTN